MTIREARLKPEFAALYPEVEPDTWLPASVAAARRAARIRLNGEAKSLARVLNPEHFEFRGGRPREGRFRLSRLADG